MNTAIARPRAWSSITAFIVALALALAGVVVGTAPVHAAAGPTVTVSVAPSGGGLVTVQGSGFDASVVEGIYVGLAPAGHRSFYLAASVALDTVWAAPGAVDASDADGRTAPLAADGSFSVTFAVPAQPEAGLAVYTSRAHGLGFGDPSQDTITAVSYAAAPAPAPIEPETPAEPEQPELPNGAPTVSVSKTAGLDRDGETITVTGAGFGVSEHPSVVGTRPPLAGRWSGAYVVFGSFADAWKPSEGAAPSARKVHSQRWLLPQATIDSNPDVFAGPGIPLAADGTFSFEMEVKEYENTLAEGNLGIYTYAAGGPAYAPFETFTPLEFAPVGPVAPLLTVSKTSGINPDGETLTIRGNGFNTTNDAPAYYKSPGLKSGFYVQVGWVMPGWAPSSGGKNSVDRASAYSAWVSNQSPPASLVWSDPTTGAFEWTVDIDAATLEKIAIEGAELAVYATGAGGYTGTDSETMVPISFAAPETEVPEPAPITPPAPVTPPAPSAPEVAPVAPVAAGSLTWGIKSAFRSYITGSIARGSVSVSGASSSGGAFVFGQTGGTYTPSAGAGTADYSGSVRFTGHSGALDLNFSNPTVEVISPQRGTLHMSINGVRVPMGTLDLAAGSRADHQGAVTYSGVPVALTAAGASAFNGFYSAGESLDTLSFTVGAPATATPASTMVVASAAAASATRTPAPTPPATSGIALVGAEAPAPGGAVTIRASGFQPNETGILVVIYSEPTVLDRNAKADASGVVTWTGVLPAHLTGEHTLTLQGSVTRGLVVDLGTAVATALAADACEVTGGALTWGFKEAFRSYVSGTIAKGEWTVADRATYETPNFGFTGATGAYDPVAGTGDVSFPGTVTFTGHGGVLNTTVGNPRIEFVDESTARLYLDVTGDTQDGASVNQAGVHFADIALSEANATTEGNRVTFADAPLVLAGAGAEAFGTYESGTDLDPLTIELATAEECGAQAATTRAPEQPDSEADPVAAEGTDWLPWIIVGVLLLVVIALVIALLARRKATAAE